LSGTICPLARCIKNLATRSPHKHTHKHILKHMRTHTQPNLKHKRILYFFAPLTGPYNHRHTLVLILLNCKPTSNASASCAVTNCSRTDETQCSQADETQCSQADETQCSQADETHCSQADETHCSQADGRNIPLFPPVSQPQTQVHRGWKKHITLPTCKPTSNASASCTAPTIAASAAAEGTQALSPGEGHTLRFVAARYVFSMLVHTHTHTRERTSRK